MKNGSIFVPQTDATSSLQSASACSRLHACWRHHVPRFATSAGVSQYITIEHSSHQLQAPAAVQAFHVHVLALHVRDSGRVPQVVQLAVRVCAAVPGVHSTVTPVQALQAPNAPHVHSFVQVRVRVCLPFPHAPQA
jgi:hypothetical protein